MKTWSVTGLILLLTGWFALVEFDHLPESERKRLIEKIKSSPSFILLILLMPVGVIVNILGSVFGSLVMIVLGATFIFLQGIIVALLFWKRKRWKSMLLLSAILVFGIAIYVPLFL